jgi:hypothetical protein
MSFCVCAQPGNRGQTSGKILERWHLYDSTKPPDSSHSYRFLASAEPSLVIRRANPDKRRIREAARMTSLRSCCITGHISQGTPTGEYIKIEGVDAYVAKPKEPSKAAIVISTDVFGYKLPNVQLIAGEDQESARSS